MSAPRPRHTGRQERAERPAADRTHLFTASNGKVWRNSDGKSSWMIPETCDALLIGLRKTASDKSDWFSRDAEDLADQLWGAMTDAGYLKQQDKEAA